MTTAIALGAWRVPWHSNLTVDDRTYLEMIQAVSAHGAPYRDGLPIERFPELRARWNVERGGRLWSVYPPLFAYVAVPAYRLGGVRGVIRFNVAMMAAIAIGVFGVVCRLGGSTTVALAAAAGAILCTPVWATSVVVTSAPLALALIIWSVRFSLDAIASGSSRGSERARRAALAGFFAGAAIATHLLSVGMIVGLGVAMSARRIGGRRIGACFGAGVLPGVAALALFNRVRFGSYNPVSYGRCTWRSCASTGLTEFTVTAQLAGAIPLIIWAVCVALAVRAVRGSRRRLAAVSAGAAAALVVVPVLRHQLVHVVTIGYALIVDVSLFDLDADFNRAATGPGLFLGPWVIKSLLQSTPFLTLAVVAPLHGSADQRRQAALVFAPCVALLASLVVRTNLPLAYALGYPFLYQRYILFAAPLLIALAAVVLGRVRWDSSAIAAAACVAFVATIWFGRQSGDSDWARRICLLWGGLALAGATFVAGVRSGRWTSRVGAVAVGYALAVTLGVDLPAIIDVRNRNDAELEVVARHTPASFALVGWPRQIDPVLALTATRDIEYADLYEVDRVTDIRGLVGWWSRTGRPVFALFPAATASPWPDVQFEPIDLAGRLVRMVPAGDEPREESGLRK